MSTVLHIDNISKQYRLGQVGTGTISHDLNRFWAKLRGKEDPYLKIGTVNDRTKASDEEYVWSLRNISLDVKKGEVLGIIGKNGAGKSTLLKILSRVTQPTIGSIKVKGRIASLLEVGTGFHPELSGRENIFLNGAILGMTKAEISAKFDEIVEFSGIERYIDTPVKRYSSGMYMRLAFAVAAHLESEVLIIDEVLAVGDAEFQKKCLGKMKDVSGQGRTVLFVSHNMDGVNKLCTRAIYLKNGELIDDGLPEKITQRYLEDTAHEKKFSNYSTDLIKINSLTFHNKQGGTSNIIQSFEPIDVIVSGEATEDLPSASFALCFDNFQEKRVVSLWSEFIGKKFPIKKGPFTIKVSIPNVHLISGEYSTVLYFENKGVEILRIDNYSKFYVNFTNKYGVVMEPLSIHGPYLEQFDIKFE